MRIADSWIAKFSGCTFSQNVQSQTAVVTWQIQTNDSAFWQMSLVIVRSRDGSPHP